MNLRLSAGRLVMQLEHEDWLIARGNVALRFIAEIKEMIPAEEREYVPEEQTWYIDPKHKDLVWELRKSLFQDARQIGLFDGT